MVGPLDRCSEERRLVHGNYGFGNVLARDGEVVAVLAWIDAKYGDFLYDVAWPDFWAEGEGTAAVVRDHYAATDVPVARFDERLRCYRDHVNLTVTDVRAAAAFLQTYFGFTNEGGNAGMAFLSDGDGFVLTLMKGGKGTPVTYPSTFYVGFFVDGEKTVDRVHARLTEDGFGPPAPQRHHDYGFYVEAPGGFTVELGA